MLLSFQRILVVVVVLNGVFALTPAAASRPSTSLGHVPDSAGVHFFPRATDQGTWTPLTNNFRGKMPDTALLLTNGTVMMHDGCTPNWWRLTPDSNGSYINGSWSPMASMPLGMAPLYFGSFLFQGGDVFVVGGEYNGAASCKNNKQIESNQAAMFFDGADGGTWSSWSSGIPWSNVGDAQTVVLSSLQPVGTQCPESCMMVAQPESRESWICCYIAGGVHHIFGKADENAEEGYTLLPDGSVLTVDTHKGVGKGQRFSVSELFTPSVGSGDPSWKRAANTANPLVDPVHSDEIGPALLLPSGHVFQAGANSCGDATQCPAYINIFEPEKGTWIAAGQFPQISGQYYDVADGPAALLPNGKVLIQAGPGYGLSPSHFFEVDETDDSLALIDGPPSAQDIATYQSRMLVLPTGEILWTSDRGDVELYTPQGGPKKKWKPAITNYPNQVARLGGEYDIAGTLFFGLSQGAAYGDDAQMATNYPLVRITHGKHVCYADALLIDASTGNWVATVGYRGTTQIEFSVPGNCDLGDSKLEVVANGIASAPVTVTVTSGN